jgi:tetratricopeptide (TPR) repeat protein
MKTILWALLIFIGGAFLIDIAPESLFAQNADANTQMASGLQAYKNSQYQDAIKHFKNAAILDPQNVNAHRYLAIALSTQYVPGVDTSENDNCAQQAINEYNIVLELDPSSINSVKSIAYLELQRKHFDEAKKYYRKAIELDANNAEAYYSVGVIDWTAAYGKRMKLRAEEKMKLDDSFVNNPRCEELKESNQTSISEGIEMLDKAMQLRKNYDDAMAYMNLMYREKADIECNDMSAYAVDLKTADHWVDVTIAAKKAKAQRQVANPQ